MGDSKKKKRSGGGGRRAQSKGHHSTTADNSEILTEEETALSCSKDTGYEDSNVCAQLSLRCLPGRTLVIARGGGGLLDMFFDLGF
ncbi:eIF-2-alpha kinase GCN2-like [Salvia miltiorrhiza]|uniref:eIF-2-alpha kinase GCN2-like n=1 Tax=Salvia miltiorrhiza TaxID=226208 RepID=UPI0025AD1712|nr:eIF-2-alpha kinase GCN2-like [Salvia miltiorrhiza]